MSARREELTRIAARLFAEHGYQGTSLADLARELGVQKPSLYHHIASKEDLLWAVASDGGAAFHAALDAVPADAPPAERVRLALRAHLAVVAGQLDVATVFVREWRYLEGERRERFLAERRRYEERIRDLFRDGVEARMECLRPLPRDLPEQVLLRGDVMVERRLLHAELRREVGERRALVAALGEEAGGDAGQLLAPRGHL